uniref:Uncharacterized protein n=1 Tax=Sphaerodactylus townsendi TaxID=933632 RepID=A0ACB8GE29_9SAUR
MLAPLPRNTLACFPVLASEQDTNAASLWPELPGFVAAGLRDVRSPACLLPPPCFKTILLGGKHFNISSLHLLQLMGAEKLCNFIIQCLRPSSLKVYERKTVMLDILGLQ